MTISQLPERPNLEQLKRQAKDLLHSAHTREAAALARFRILPTLAAHTDTALAQAGLALHDAQSVIAREHGFPSWTALRERVEELTLQFAEAVDEFLRAATDGRATRAARLLALHPGVARASFYTALVCGDVETVAARLRDRPELATARGGARDWEPLGYICHATPLGDRAGQAEGWVAIARALLDRGADANTTYPWLHHGVRRSVLWGAVCVTRSLALAEVLLRAGASPNDGVTLTLAAGGGNLPALELLVAHGADVNHPWATDGAPPLTAMLQWTATTDGAHWLLAHGADPNRAGGPTGERALHVAAQTWDVKLVEALVRHGAELSPRRTDGRTPLAVAELNGNRAVADWLRAQGAPDELSPVDRWVAAAVAGDRATAEALVAAQPALREELRAEHHEVLRRAAERGEARALATMLAVGFDANVADAAGCTALHRAAMAGRVEAVRVLLAHGASVRACDAEFRAQPLIWAAEGSRHPKAEGADHAEVARLLLAAGSSTEWAAQGEPSVPLLELLAEWRRAWSGNG